MNNARKAAVACFAASAVLFGAVACTSETDDDCRTSTVYVPMFFSTVDHHFHYGSPSGKVVPAAKVPSTARKVPGYKAPAAPKVPTNKAPKTDGKPPAAPKPAQPPTATVPKPAPAPAPAPAPRPRIR